MAFTLENLRADARYFVFGNSTNTDYGNTDLDRNINRWYNTVLGWVLSSNGEWQVNGEVATSDLVADQREYILPTDILKLNKIFIKPTSSSDYLEATQRDKSAIHVDDSLYLPYPPEFDLFDNSMFVYLDQDITAVTDGIKITYQTNLTELAETSDAPNLAEPFKRLLSLGAALDYCLANEVKGKAKNFKVMIDETKQELIDFYANRSTVKPIVIEPSKENY